jgi:hypothetical protein
VTSNPAVVIAARVSRLVTAAYQGGPDVVGEPLDPGQADGVRSDVLEEA